MSKAKFKEKQKKLHEQRVRLTEGTEVVPAWDYDFSGANEVHQSDDFEPLESVALFITEGKSKTREKFKKKRDKARHKLDVSVSPETASDYLASLNARDAVPPTVLVRDDIPDNVQESTLSKPASRPIFEPAIKKTSKTLSIVEMAGELKKYVHIISYGNTLYYHNKYYYTQLDAKQLIKLYRKYVDYELNNESSLHGYKDLYDCFMTDPKIECNESEDEPIYAPLKNGVFELVEWKLHPHSDKTFGIDRMTWNGDTMNTLEQLGVISALNDSYRESHGLASSNALDSAFDELENALDDAFADSASSEAEPESETASVSVAESVPYTETADAYDAEDVFPAATRFDEQVTSTNGMDTHSKLAGEISVNHNGYEELTEEQREYFLSYGSYFQTAWLNAMYTDIYEDTGRYGNAVAWVDFVNYLYFYDEVTNYCAITDRIMEFQEIEFDFDDEYDMDTVTDIQAASYVDEVIQTAEANGAELQIW